MHRFRSRARPLAASVLAVLLAACAPAGGQSGPTATPLSNADLQRLYAAAAAAYNRAELPIEQAENVRCTAGSGTSNLAQCETALNQDRQASIAFDNALRGLTFPDSARSDVSRLLGDDAQLEALLEQAATAPSLTAIQALTGQIFSLLSTTTADAASVRADIGLPPVSSPSATP